MLVNKHIILGVTGGIAAYKSAELIRRLRELGAEVRVVMTAAAKQFITSITLQALSGHPVRDELFDTEAEAAMGHIELARWADMVLVAPASADFLAQLTHGRAQDLLGAICLASQAPVVVVPAMNQQMWHDLATQQNIQQLKQRGIPIWGPAAGGQACGEVGLGRMLEVGDIVQAAIDYFRQGSLDAHTVVITAGATIEPIDPVRYISNYSSGKMGYALAEAALATGAIVILISGPCQLAKPVGVQFIAVTTALEMHQAVMAVINNATMFIGCAAVCDYRIAEVAQQKIKKSQHDWQLTLQPNPDIIAAVSQLPERPITVGFAAETENVLVNAEQKRQRKGLDLIIANKVAEPDRGFTSDYNQVTILGKNIKLELPCAPKQRIAAQIIQLLAKTYGRDHREANHSAESSK